MAQRYGGTHSPGTRPLAHSRPVRMGARMNLLFIAPLFIALTSFFRDPAGLFAGLAGFALLMAAAYLTREGIRAETAFAARKIARRPALPRKMLGSILTGLGLAVAFADPLPSILIGILGAGLHLAAFGPDPLASKGTGEGDIGSDRVARVIDEAETLLAEIRAIVLPLRDRHLTDRTDRFIDAARGVIETVENDPTDLTRARKFLGVYLRGARDAARKFADLYARTGDVVAKTRFEALLDDLGAGYVSHREKLLLNDRSDLDIEIEVLRERLDREGVPTE